jgi:hypothetical protein
MFFLVSAAALVGTEQRSTGPLVPLYFPLSEFVNTGGQYNTRETIRESSPATNPVFSMICNCWLTELQPEMVECKQQNCYIELIKSAKGEKNDFS